ncbi:isoprenyl transferase [Simkania sp.]|uniref:isoprenyl transferase n=1 Tax=Simkania sp. TaxID=34094 RepID=UPI003B52EAE2
MTHPNYTETEKPIFSQEELSLIDSKKIPQHVAIIMDGNRRWAKKWDKPVEVGHWQGAETLDQIVRAAIGLGIKVLTVYSFSTENWNRSSEEVDALMHLLKTYLNAQRETMVKEGVRLKSIGDLSKLPEDVQQVLRETKEATKGGSQIDLVLALNYGGRDDIRRATLRLLDEVEAGRIQRQEITEKTISNFLDTAQWPDPDLLIRPSGDLRISNFLIWQISYSEIYYTDVLWPDFSKSHLLSAVIEFQKRNRRFGL